MNYRADDEGRSDFPRQPAQESEQRGVLPERGRCRCLRPDDEVRPHLGRPACRNHARGPTRDILGASASKEPR